MTGACVIIIGRHPVNNTRIPYKKTNLFCMLLFLYNIIPTTPKNIVINRNPTNWETIKPYTSWKKKLFKSLFVTNCIPVISNTKAHNSYVQENDKNMLSNTNIFWSLKLFKFFIISKIPYCILYKISDIL